MADYNDALTEEERLLIKKYDKFYESLNTGEKKPTSKDQKHFVEVCRGHALPQTEHEIAYAKYIGIYPKREENINLKRTYKSKGRDINYKPQYQVKYSCMVCLETITVTTHHRDKQRIEAICHNCNTYRWFTKVRTVSKTPGIFETKCWNCGTEVSNATCKRDGWHGLICNNCGESLRDYKK